jgi:hypothetical protein
LDVGAAGADSVSEGGLGAGVGASGEDIRADGVLAT